MIRGGSKTIETRTWETDYRGPLLIVASKKPYGLFAGMAVAKANLVACRRMDSWDEDHACCCYDSKLYSWVLEDVVKVNPFPVRGRLGLYDVELPGGVIL